MFMMSDDYYSLLLLLFERDVVIIVSHRTTHFSDMPSTLPCPHFGLILEHLIARNII